MTTQSNIKIVAELYWTLKAIKEATGVTPKCWRPPQGDGDDRVRSIAWQMGMRTILWNEDTNDWDMVEPMNGGNLSPKKVDGYFQGWINAQKAGKLKTGILVLEHELNRATVNMTMHWLPTLQKTFNVVPALTCAGITEPYWESGFVYPSDNTPTKTSTATSGATPTSGSQCTSGSFGLENGDGYNGYCCKTQADCIDDCISGKCNGPSNPNKSTTTKTKTSTKKTTTKSTPTSTASCIPGSRGKKRGDGKDGYCCSTSDDCLETCRKGRCGL